jgi:hypothetical protein
LKSGTHEPITEKQRSPEALMHSLLARQIERHLADTDIGAEPWRSFLTAVDDTYRSVDIVS